MLTVMRSCILFISLTWWLISCCPPHARTSASHCGSYLTLETDLPSLNIKPGCCCPATKYTGCWCRSYNLLQHLQHWPVTFFCPAQLAIFRLAGAGSRFLLLEHQTSSYISLCQWKEGKVRFIPLCLLWIKIKTGFSLYTYRIYNISYASLKIFLLTD